MDVRQLSIQIGTQQAGGELQLSGPGSPFGSPSHDRGFSTILQALSRKTDGNRDAKPRAPQAETDDRPPSATLAAHRGLSCKTDGGRDAEPRSPQAKTDDQPPTTTPAAHRTASRKADGSRDAEPHDSQPKTEDGPPTTMSDASTTASDETSSSTDTAFPASQPKPGDAPSTITCGAEPLVLSLLGATMVMQASPVASTQEAAGTDASTNHADGLIGMSGTSTIQPTAQPAEGVESAVRSETGLSTLAGHNTASATGDAVAALSSPMPEPQARFTEPDAVMPPVEKPNISQPLTVLQGQKAERGDPHQGFPITEQPEKGVPQAPVSLGQAPVNERDPAQLVAPVTTQPTHRNSEGVEAQPDRSPVQPILTKAEPLLHQKNTQTESSETQAAAALSGYTSADGQNFKQASDGQRKEDGLKWFSHADLQSAEVSPRGPQESMAEPLDSGRQDLSYHLGQGGAPSTIKLPPTTAVSPSPQPNRLSLDTTAAPAPLTHAVQFDLAPSDFGQLRVRVVLSDQTIHTHMSTDHAELGQMLTSRQEQLSTQLSSAGLDLGRFQVQVDQGRTNQSGQEWQSQSQSGTSQQQRDSRQQDHSPETPVPSQKRTGMLSLFA